MKTVTDEQIRAEAERIYPNTNQSMIRFFWMDGAKWYRSQIEDQIEWIDVEERLPEYGEKVLVIIDDTSKSIHPDRLIDIDFTVSVAHGVKKFDCEVNTSEKVTHWQPLPKNPTK